METTITCRDLGFDCDFEARILTGTETLTTIMRHVQTTHTRDWFEREDIHAKLRSLLRGIAVLRGGCFGDP
jgi:predicted small metal-binding protein